MFKPFVEPTERINAKPVLSQKISLIYVSYLKT